MTKPKIFLHSFSILSCLLLAPVCATSQQSTHAQPPAATAPHYPPVDVTGISTANLPSGTDLNGHYDCEGAFGNKRVHRSAFEVQTPLVSTWLELDERDIEPATGYQGKYLIGYDTAAHHMIEFDANNFGAAIYSSEDGWVNGKLTMTSPISTDPKASYAANRFLYTILSADSFSVDWQISRSATLAWITADHLLCKRSSTQNPASAIR